MKWATAVVFWAAVSCSSGSHLKFPPWLKFGSASAAYQVEGAWNVSDKGESKWDRLTHKYPEIIEGGSNGDDACNSYYQWERDIEIVAEMGLEFYRFSINWPRLLPNGLINYISEDGKNYYNKLIDGLLAKGIEPVITIYHWEMPQMLQDFGGWTNPQIVDWFGDYARLVYTLYGDRVKTWFTINEPVIECDFYFGPGVLSPNMDYFVGPYLCNKNILLAHAKAWRIYDEEFRHKYNGKVSIVNQLLWMEPYSDEFEELTETAREFFTGRYSHPIYSKEGGWPPVVEEVIAKSSKELGFKESRLPAFTEEEKNFIKGTYDYYGLNYYTTRQVRLARPSEKIPKFILESIVELNVILDADPDWEYGKTTYLPVRPDGLRAQMLWIKEKYGDMEIFIAENGLSSAGSNIDDHDRISYIRAHLEQVALSIQDGVNVTGYTYWTLMDNFEWIDGYLSKFGLYEVDFSDPMRTRTPRDSARYYAEVIKNRAV